MQKMAHKMVAETAKGIAGSLYETLMGQDRVLAGLAEAESRLF